MTTINIATATVEEKTAVSNELGQLLGQLGAKNPKRHNITSSLSGRRWVNIKGGCDLRWSKDFEGKSIAIVLTRYAEGDQFSPTRVINAGVYLQAIVDAGFIAELTGKTVTITGKVA